MATILREQIDLSEATVDAENRVIRDVVLIKAGMSINRKQYPESVLRQAVQVFEGVKAYDSHMPGTRKVADTTGWYSNVTFREGALRADRYFTRNQAGSDVWAIAEDIVSKRAPASLAGLSINAVGVVKASSDKDGAYHMVESITGAKSVDDVTTPAAGGTYLTASAGDELADLLIKAMTLDEVIAARPDVVKRLTGELKNMRESDAVKAAKTAADHNRIALTEANTTIAGLTTRLDAAVLAEATARRALAIHIALEGVKLPPAWIGRIRKALTESEPAEWSGIIGEYQAMAKEAGAFAPRRVLVEGASQQVMRDTPPKASAPINIAESLDWDRVQHPQDLAKIQSELAKVRND